VNTTYLTQVSAESFLTDIIYILACIGVLLDLFALLLLDAATVHPRNLIDTIVQKIVATMVGCLAVLPVGYAIWSWQFYAASGNPHPLATSLADWWIGGRNVIHFAQHLDPALTPNADTQQIFLAFFCLFGGVIAAFIHSAGVERMKALPCYVLSAIAAGLIMPVLAYATFGSAGPLTNAGLHDFVGDYSLYIFMGCWALVLAVKLGPRQRISTKPNFALFACGVFLLLIGVPLFVIGSGYVQPGQGYFGISMAESGLGIVVLNLFAAFSAGGVAGALVAYRLEAPLYALLGPISGYVACSALLDIARPWQALATAFVAPFITVACAKLIQRLRIDEPKIVAVALGPGIYGALMAGVVGSGLPAGGYFGVNAGVYAFQHARISFTGQLLGVVLVLAFSFASGWLVITLVEKTLGLRVHPSVESSGLDRLYWRSGMVAPIVPEAAQTGTSDSHDRNLVDHKNADVVDAAADQRLADV
jgi:ammonium transporter, Amt family